MNDEDQNDKLSEEELNAATGGAGADDHPLYDKFVEDAYRKVREWNENPGLKKAKNR